MVKASVIVPVYNEEAFLKECLDSILNQTLADMEVLCVDAGSTDASPAILAEYAAKDPRLQILSGFGRLDAGTARNLGLDRAAGEYLAFLDADDYFDPRLLEDTCRKADADGSDIVIFRARQQDMSTGALSPMPWSLKNRHCPKHSPFAPEEMAEHLFNAFENWTWNKLFRRDFVLEKGIRFQAIPRTNDMAFTCEALALARRISCLPQAYTTYRTGTGTSLQQTNDHSPTCFWEAYRETRQRLLAAGVYETYARSFLNTVLSGTMYNLRSVKTEASRQAILELICSPETAFPLEGYPKGFFYNRSDHNQYLLLRCGTTPGAFGKLADGIHGVIQCCADHGVAYTVKYAFQKLLR